MASKQAVRTMARALVITHLPTPGDSAPLNSVPYYDHWPDNMICVPRTYVMISERLATTALPLRSYAVPAAASHYGATGALHAAGAGDRPPILWQRQQNSCPEAAAQSGRSGSIARIVRLPARARMRNSAGHAELAMLYLDSRDAGIPPSEKSADSREHLPRSGRMSKSDSG